jgi:DNA-directed RNA polymerase subunit RPC12/RpoP
LPSKKAKPKAASKKRNAKPAKAAGGSGQEARLVCAECSSNFTTKIAINNFEKEVGRKFSCPKCGAVYELISLLEGRITVTILAKGETRTYGKTYDITGKDYARPL